MRRTRIDNRRFIPVTIGFILIVASVATFIVTIFESRIEKMHTQESAIRKVRYAIVDTFELKAKGVKFYEVLDQFGEIHTVYNIPADRQIELHLSRIRSNSNKNPFVVDISTIWPNENYEVVLQGKPGTTGTVTRKRLDLIDNQNTYSDPESFVIGKDGFARVKIPELNPLYPSAPRRRAFYIALIYKYII